MLLRFAPSPTGYMHVGNARVALANFLLGGGKPENLVLRYDDTDVARCKPEYEQAIGEDLRWLGIGWGQELYQSRRLGVYEDIGERLKAKGRLYACYETAEELEYARNRLRARGLPPVYNRAGLTLSADQRARLESEGRTPHWRFLLNPGRLEWHDLVRGACSYDAAHLSDPVVIREDGTFLYMLPSVIDDAQIAITHIVRGEDHITNTAVQIQMFQALDAPLPAFAHLPLLIDASGAGLSKRLGSLSLQDLRRQGVEAMAVNSLLARLGSSDAIEAAADLASLAASYDISHIGRAPPRFDPTEIDRLTQKILHSQPYEAVVSRLPEGVGEALWLAVRGNIATLADVGHWLTVVTGPLTPVIAEEDRAFLQEAAGLLTELNWKAWTAAVGASTGRKGKALFMPLRRALTGEDHGPEMAALLPLMNREAVIKRLNGETA